VTVLLIWTQMTTDECSHRVSFCLLNRTHAIAITEMVAAVIPNKGQLDVPFWEKIYTQPAGFEFPHWQQIL
jgi:hypothetical protein